MRLRVFLRRQVEGEPQWGYLRAWVKQEGKLGMNLLEGKKVQDVDVAKRMARERLPQGVEVEWDIRA